MFNRQKAAEGDLILVSGSRPLTAWDTRPEEDEELVPDGRGGRSGGRGGRGRGGRGRGARGRGRGRGRRSSSEEIQAAPPQEIVRVTAEDVLLGVFGIEHVVIPLPGGAQ